MQSKHTQGEWEVSKMVNDFSIFCDNKEIAAVFQYSRNVPMEEAQANAKLIAASSEMYEVLTKLIDKFNDVKTVHELGIANELNYALSILNKINY